MATLKERILEAACRVGKAKDELEKAQKEYDELFKQTSPSRPRSQIENADGVKKQILESLLNFPNGVDFKDVAKSIGENSKTVRVLLYALKVEGEVDKIGRGKWKHTKFIEKNTDKTS